MIMDNELRRSVQELVRAEVRYLEGPGQKDSRAALLEALERLDERGEYLGQSLGWLVAHELKQEL